MTVILRPAIAAITLDDALLTMSTYHNGCDFRLRVEGNKYFLEWGCYPMSGLMQGKRHALAEWLGEFAGASREIVGAKPETIAELLERQPCRRCGGFIFKDMSKE